MARILPLTGASGIGKSTVIRSAADALAGRPLRGFWSDEVTEVGRRVGFRLEAFGGERATLAHVRSKSPHRLGRYGVEVAALDDQDLGRCRRSAPRSRGTPTSTLSSPTAPSRRTAGSCPWPHPIPKPQKSSSAAS